MAPRNEQSDRDLNTDINAAIAGTEDEIFRDALDSDLDDNDGDRSLEETGDGLEGEVLDEDDINVEDTEGPEADEDDEDDEGDDEDEAEDDEEVDEADEDEDEDEGEETDEEPRRDQRGRFDKQQPRIPTSRLREATEKTRQVEQERDQYRTQVTTLEARFNDLLQRVNSGQVGPPANTAPQAAPVKPDMFSDPEGYERWVIGQAEERAQARVNQALADRDRQQQEQVNSRVDQSFNEAARGPRSFEFQPAYNALTSLNPKDPQAQKLVRGIFNSPDPKEALFAWWDENGGEDFRDNIARQLGFKAEPQRRQRRDDGGDREVRQQVRHEIRPARTLRSLNSASGGNSNRVSDPDMLDGSEGSVFDYATRR